MIDFGTEEFPVQSARDGVMFHVVRCGHQERIERRGILVKGWNFWQDTL